MKLSDSVQRIFKNQSPDIDYCNHHAFDFQAKERKQKEAKDKSRWNFARKLAKGEV